MIKPDRSLTQLRVIYVATTIFLVALSLYAFTQIKNLIDSSNRVNRTKNVTLSLQKISTAISDAETNQRGYLLTGDSSLLTRRDMAFNMLGTELNLVDSLTSDNPEQVQHLKALHIAVNEKVAIMKKVMQGYSPLQMSAEYRVNMVEGVSKMENVKRQIRQMSTIEENLLDLGTRKYARLSFITPLFIVILFLGALFILLVSYFRINDALKHSQQLQLRLEEEKILAQTVLNSSTDNIIVIDRELRYMTANSKAEKVLHQLSPSYVGKKVTDLFPNTETLSDMAKALKGETVYHYDFYSASTDLHFEVIYAPLKKGNEVVGIVAQSRDITSILKTNKQLAKQNEDLEKMNKELQSFTYISSHDLQEPLRKIQTFATLIIEKEHDTLSINAKEHFNRMQNAAKRMQTLIEDLLAYSRTNSSERKFEITNLNKIIEEVKTELNDTIQEKHATIEVTELCEANVIAFQFRQLLHNLIGNALKFSNPSIPPLIKIRGEVASGQSFNNPKLSPQGKYFHLSVADNGIGFESQYSEKIFEVFQRLHGKTEYNGTGIGLAIVKKIVDNHNGIITAHGELGRGAIFNIYIPTA